MPKALPPCRLFPLCGDRGALAHGIGHGRLGRDFQQALALLIGQITAAGQGPVDMFLTVIIPVKMQAHLDLAQLPPLALGIHAQGDGSAGTEAGQQQLVGVGATVAAAQICAFIGTEPVLPGLNLLDVFFATAYLNSRHGALLDHPPGPDTGPGSAHDYATQTAMGNTNVGGQERLLDSRNQLAWRIC